MAQHASKISFTKRANRLLHAPRKAGILAAAGLAVVLSVAFIAFAKTPSVPSASNATTGQQQTAVAGNSTFGEVSDNPKKKPVQARFFEGLAGDPQAIAAALEAVPVDEMGRYLPFSLDAASVAPTLSDAQIQAIDDAVQDLGCEVAFMLVNGDTGQGLCYNAGEPLYAASSSKAWFCFFLCGQVEQGARQLTDTSWNTLTDQPPLNLSAWENPYCMGGLIENAIVLSDNFAYESLRESYEDQAYYDWLAQMGLESVSLSFGNWYPDLTPLQCVTLWMNLYSYLQTGTETAQWYGGLLKQTEVSYLREALEGQKATVYDKGGWDAGGGWAGGDCTADSGVVEIDGTVYFFSIIAQAYQSDEHAWQVENIISAVFDAAPLS